MPSLCLNSRVLPRSLSFCPRFGEGSFCRPTLLPRCRLTRHPCLPLHTFVATVVVVSSHNLVYRDVVTSMQSGFYLGYLRGRSFPPKMPSFPPKILLSSQYISNYIEKISKTRGEHTVTFLKIVSPNAPDCISAHVHFKKFPGVGSGPLEEACRLRPLRTSPSNDKS